jgi:hypothetical protein
MDMDYPAAHSMDSQWFAVDRDGHVALFETGESGSVPAEVMETRQRSNPFRSGEHIEVREPVDVYALLAEIAALVPRTEVIFDPRGRTLPGPFGETHAPFTRGGSLQRILLLLEATDLVEKDLADGRAVRLSSTDPPIVWFPRISRALLTKLHNRDQCLACAWLWHQEATEHEPEIPIPAALGLFYYAHLDGAEPYDLHQPFGRVQAPARPMHLDQVPPSLRTILGRFRMRSICFAEQTHTHPAEHSRDCLVWGDGAAYLASDGSHVHPLPGKENEYHAEFHDLVRNLTRNERGKLLHLEEPPSGPKKPRRPKRKDH